MQSETVFPVDEGTVITVTCPDDYNLEGDGEVTCIHGTNFGTNMPRFPRCEVKSKYSELKYQHYYILYSR